MKSINEFLFSEQELSPSYLNKLLTQHLLKAQDAQNVYLVEELVLSQENGPDTQKTIRQNQATGIPKTSVPTSKLLCCKNHIFNDAL